MSFNPAIYNDLSVTESPIKGLYVLQLPVHGDNRGWFKENYQKEKMEALGLPAFTVVQNNFSYNEEQGVTRGLHAEPWEKYISVANVIGVGVKSCTCSNLKFKFLVLAANSAICSCLHPG